MPYDIVTLGEPLLRLTPPRYKPLNRADSLDVEVGGSEANTAVGLASLGLRALYWTRMSDNPLGQMIARSLQEYGVDTSAITWTEKDRIGTYYYEDAPAPRQPRVVYDRANSAASKMRPSDLPAALFSEGNSQLLHLTGITPALSHAANNTALHALKLAQEANWRISFDVNFRGKLWSASDAQSGIEPFLRAADIAFIPLRDACLLYGIAENTPVERVLDTLAAYYPQAVWVMTIGAGGAIARDRDGLIWKQAAYDAQTISRIGSGDAFDAGFLAAYLETYSMAEALKWGCAAAALKRSIPGDLAALTREDIKRVTSAGQRDVSR